MHITFLFVNVYHSSQNLAGFCTSNYRVVRIKSIIMSDIFLDSSQMYITFLKIRQDAMQGRVYIKDIIYVYK